MAEDKEIRIRAVLDASTFDRGVNEIQQKLKRMMQESSSMQGATQGLKGDSLLGKYAQQAFGDFSKESQQQLERMYQTQRREALNQKINMRDKQQQLEKIQKSDEQLTNQQKERVKLLKEELQLMQQKHRQTLNSAAETAKAMGQMGMPTGVGGATGAAGSAGLLGGMAGGMKQMLQAIGVGALVKGIVDAVVTGAGHMITRERKITQDIGAGANIASIGLKEQFQGRGSRGMFFARERADAAQMAAQEQSKMEILDYVKAGGGALAGGIAGGVFGGPIGAIGGAAAGFSATMISSERLRSRLFDQQRYRSMLNKEGMQNYQSNLAAINAAQPDKVIAQQYFEQNAGAMSGLQQTLGMGSDQEYLDFMKNNINAGIGAGGTRFNQKMVMQQVQALAGGGATTSGIKGLNSFANTLSRQFNLSGGGRTLGQMSGAGLGEGESQDAMLKLLSEAVRRGIDVSKMPQEMQRMTAMTAQIATQGGGFASGAVNIAMAGVEGFDKTSISAAGSAAGAFKQAAKTAGGYEGQMGLSFLQSKKATQLLGGKKLSAKDMNYLNQLSFTETTDEDIQRIAGYLGVTTQQVQDLLQEKDIYKQSRTGSEGQAYSELGQFLKKNNKMSPADLGTALSKGEGGRLMTKAMVERTSSRSSDFSGLSRQQQRAQVLQQARLSSGIQMSEGIESAVLETMNQQEGRGGFLQAGSEGTGDIAMLQALQGNIKQLRDAASKHTVLAEEYNIQFKLFIDAAKQGENATGKFAQALSNVADKLEERYGIIGYSTGDSSEESGE